MLENLSEEDLLKLLDKADDKALVTDGKNVFELKNIDDSDERLAKVRSAFLAFIRKIKLKKADKEFPVDSLYQFFLLGSGVYCSQQLFITLMEQKLDNYNSESNTFKINYNALEMAFRMEGWLLKQKELIADFRWFIRQRSLLAGDHFTTASVVYHLYKISKARALDRKVMSYTEMDLMLFRFFPCRRRLGEVNLYGINEDLASRLNEVTLRSLKLLDKRLFTMLKRDTGLGVRDFKQKAELELLAESKIEEFLADQEREDAEKTEAKT